MMKIHVVRKGDTLYDIAKKYGVDLDVLIAANPQIDDPDVLMIGQKIRIPSKGVAETPPRQAELTPQAAAKDSADGEVVAADGGEARDAHRGDHDHHWNNNWNHDDWNKHGDDDDRYFHYTVRPGDTLWEIAHRFGLSLQELIAANPQIENPDLIRVGEVIRIPHRKPIIPPHWPPMGPGAHYPPYGKHDSYGMPRPPMMPVPYSSYGPCPGPGWGFPWSFVPPSGQSGGKEKCKAAGEHHSGPWMPFTVWVPYEHSYFFYADWMPGHGGYEPAAPYGMEKAKKWCRGGEEQEEPADA